MITHLLTLFDGAVTDRTGVVLLGATNAFDRLDAALVRSGRFERRFDIVPPTAADLAQALRLHLGDGLAGVDLTPIASLRPGATGADAARWARDARALARAAGRETTLTDLMAVVAPAEDRPAESVRLVAIHEAGHAVAYLATGLPVRSVSIIQTENTGGVTTARLYASQHPTAADQDAPLSPCSRVAPRKRSSSATLPAAPKAISRQRPRFSPLCTLHKGLAALCCIWRRRATPRECCSLTQTCAARSTQS